VATESKCSVLVVGAGPVGLMCAAELRRHGVACRIVERLDAARPYCKALGVAPRTMEVFDDLGIANAALDAGLGVRGLINMIAGNREISEEFSTAIPDGAYGFLLLAQNETERILAEHLRSLGGEVERGIELAEFNAGAANVAVTLKHADGSQETVVCDWLVGCDGGRSAVRRGLGLAFEGDHYEHVFMLADVEIDWPEPRGYAYKIAKFENNQMVGGGAIIPVPGNPKRYRISAGAPPEIVPKDLMSAGQPQHGLLEQGPTFEQSQKLLDWFYPGAKASNMRWSAFYRISHRIVGQYRVGRAFVVGDAAHLHPPLGGQGMNAGLQDAYNLAWKLALAVRGQAAATLLDSYDAERRPIGEQIVSRTAARMDKVIGGKPDTMEPVRDDSQLFLNYRGSDWVANDDELAKRVSAGPLAGDRAPDAIGLRRPFVRYDARLFDLTRGTHHTLFFYTNHSNPAADCAEFASVVEALRKQYAGLIQAYALVHPDFDLPAIEGLSILADSQNEFARLYGATRKSAFLIRPDGYVGYRGEPLEAERLAAHLKMVFA
jgi:2-polyprenyl-6-methoxyphenol hydroxylase-like FAD-dependent oxidoreductase